MSELLNFDILNDDNELDFQLNANEQLEFEIKDKNEVIVVGKVLNILNELGIQMPNREKLQFNGLETVDDGIDKTIVEVNLLSNIELEEMLTDD